MHQNISENILQMYRDEDLVRAFAFDLQLIGDHMIKHLPITNIEKLVQVNYYEALIENMKNEGIEKNGHLARAHHLVDLITDLHKELIKSDQNYQVIMSAAKSHIDENILLSENTVTNVVQICLNGVYGFLLLKLNGKKISPDDQIMIDRFGDVLSYLNFRYAERLESN